MFSIETAKMKLLTFIIEKCVTENLINSILL